MKHKICLCIAGIAASFLLTSCGSADHSDTAAASESRELVDLTQMNSNMIYAQVSDMISHPENYSDKDVRASGTFAYYQDKQTGKEYFAVIVADATACCSQGIEFVLDGEHNYPEDYPELNTEITVTGEFSSYTEYGTTYCQLLHADMKKTETAEETETQ